MEMDPELEGLTSDELIGRIKEVLEEINDEEKLEAILELTKTLPDLSEEQADIMFDYLEGKEQTVEIIREAAAYAKGIK